MPSQKKRAAAAMEARQRADSWLTGIAGILIPAIFIIQPLIMMPDTYVSITSTKLYTFASMILVGAFLLLMAALLAGSTVPGYFRWKGFPAFFRAIRPYEYALLGYWLAMALSTVFAMHPLKALLGSTNRNEGLLVMTLYLLACAIAGRFYKPKERDFLILCAVAALVSAYGIFQYYGLDFLHLNPEEIKDVYGPSLLYISTMSNRNVFSTYLCVVFCVCVGFFTRKEADDPTRWAYLGTGWILFYMLILDRTESGYVGMAVAFASLFPFLADTRRRASRFFAMMAGCMACLWLSTVAHGLFPEWEASAWQVLLPYLLPAALALAAIAALLRFVPGLPELPARIYRICWYGLIALLIALTLFLLPTLAQRTGNKTLTDAAQVFQGNFADELGSNRMFIWKRALSLVPERPLLGHGPDNFYPVFDKRFGEEGREKNFATYDKMHNEYLQNLFDNGILGLGALLAFFFLAVRGGIRRASHPLTMALLLAMVCFLGQAFFNFSSPFAHPIVWTTWGILAALGLERATQEETTHP